MGNLLREMPLAAVLVVYGLLVAGIARKLLRDRRERRQLETEQRLLDYLELNSSKKGRYEE